MRKVLWDFSQNLRRMMQKINKAVIPVAGYGTRFLPFTKAVPKAMLPIVNRPAVQVVVEEAVAAGIEEIYLVIGQHKDIIEAHFSPSIELEGHLKKCGDVKRLEEVRRLSDMAKITYIVQEKQTGTASAVLCAEKYIGNEPFAVMFGDDVMLSEKPVIGQLSEVYAKTGKTTIGVKNVGFDNVFKYASVEFDKQDGRTYNATAITEKPDPGTAKSDLAPLGRYIFNSDIFEILHNLKPGKNNEYQLTDAFRYEIERRGVIAYAFEGARYDMGDVYGYLQANMDFALRDKNLADKLKAHIDEIR